MSKCLEYFLCNDSQQLHHLHPGIISAPNDLQSDLLLRHSPWKTTSDPEIVPMDPASKAARSPGSPPSPRPDIGGVSPEIEGGGH